MPPQSILPQLQTLLWARWRLFWNAQGRRTGGRLEMLLTALMIPLAGLAALAAAVFVTLGALSLADARVGTEPARMVFVLIPCGVFFLLQILPFFSGSTRTSEMFDPERLALLPIGQGRLLGFNLLMTLTEPMFLFFLPSVLAGGIALWTAGLPGLLAALVFWAFCAANVPVYHMLASLAESILRVRRWRELFILLVPAIWFAVWMLPSMLKGKGWAKRELFEQAMGWLAWTPPGLAGEGMRAALSGEVLLPLGAVAVQIALALVAWQLDLRLLTRTYFGAGAGSNSAPVRKKGSPGRGLHLPFVPYAIVAAIEKELKYLFRTPAGRYNFLGSLLLVFLVTSGRFMGGQGSTAGLLFVLMLETFIVTQMADNCFGMDGDGVLTWMLLPVHGRQVLAGKNAAVGVYLGILTAWVLLLFSLMSGNPLSPGMALFALGWTAAAFLPLVALGNFLSVLFPFRIRTGRLRTMRRLTLLQSITSSLAHGVAMVPAAATAVVFYLSGSPWWGLACLAVVLPVLAVLYRLLLGAAGERLELRQEELYTALADQRDE